MKFVFVDFLLLLVFLRGRALGSFKGLGGLVSGFKACGVRGGHEV